MLKIKNILIFVVIGVILFLIYFFFIKSPSDTATLSVVSSPNSAPTNTVNSPSTPVAGDFLNLLLSVKNIKLDDAIFSDNAFISLRDSSIILTPDGNEGRPNPFAAFGVESISVPIR